ncbi:hypothetical protein [Legionella clemsonensis]|uniref:Uncharacterized protein n=1 Tax=Legionella clemsonensis TaxID=1867846 RepID=A0A222NZ63_9GAMM|nr:hypothetical protein [Legionella clemsonensis]ASQ44882.1 hypothetical protein clem_01590 [Legionella clemsonensis]
MTVGLSLEELEARLPELEWQMRDLGHMISTKTLPKGLFRLSEEASPAAFINEIKQDINSLTNYQNGHSGCYLAQRIQQKINVLVALCRLKVNPLPPPDNYYLNMITTRQHYVEALEKEIASLSKQRQALKSRLEQINEANQLNLHAEVGEIEKRLTLAQEAILRVTKW